MTKPILIAGAGISARSLNRANISFRIFERNALMIFRMTNSPRLRRIRADWDRGESCRSRLTAPRRWHRRPCRLSYEQCG
jgi:hypothetical protein